MKTNTTFSCVLIIFFMSLTGCAGGMQTSHFDDFEGGRKHFWSSSNRNGDATSRSGPSKEAARTGKYSYKFHVKKGDFKASSDRQNDRERQEMYNNQSVDPYGEDVWYKYSILFSESFPTSFYYEPVVVGQWKHIEQYKGRSPFLSFRVGTGPNDTIDTQFVVKNIEKPNGGFSMPAGYLEKNKWYDIVVNFRNSVDTDGYVNAWINGKKVISYSGPTGQVKGSSYFKLGIYRRSMNPDMVVFVDSFARTNESPVKIGLNF
jgi:hypothetical protein